MARKKMVSFRLDQALLRLMNIVSLLENRPKTSLVEKSLSSYLHDPARIERVFRAVCLALNEFEKGVSDDEIERLKHLYPLPRADYATYAELARRGNILNRLLKANYPPALAEYISSLEKNELLELRHLVGSIRLQILYRETLEREMDKL